MTKIPNFENSRRRTAAILKIVLSLYQRNLVGRCRLYFQGRLLNKIPKFCKFKMADGRHTENRLLAISTNDYPINAKFYRINQNHVLTEVIWPKYQISKIQDGAWPPFWKKMVLSLYLSRKSSDFNEIWYADADCASEVGYITKC